MLLDGFKFDVRLYVLIVSVDPLKVFLYNDGLARLCTTPYTPPGSGKDGGMGARTAHLSNYTLNKRSADFAKGSDGSKRSLKDVFATLKRRGVDVDLLWNGTIDVVNSAILAVGPKLRRAYRAVVPKGSVLHSPSASTCYEILGVDVMWDTDLKSWLLEVNHMPSFRGGSRVDNRIKTGVIRQTLSMLRVSLRRKRKLQARCRREWERYMFVQAGCTPPRPRSGLTASSSSLSSLSLSAEATAVAASSSPAHDSRRPKTVSALSPDSSSRIAATAPALGEAETAALLEMCGDDDESHTDSACASSEEAAALAALPDADEGGSGCDADTQSRSGAETQPPTERAGSTTPLRPASRKDSMTSDDGEESAGSDEDESEGSDGGVGGADASGEDDDAGEIEGEGDGEAADVFVAPLPGTPDEFVRIYSGLSRRCRAAYASVITAADTVFSKDPPRPLKVPPPRKDRYGRDPNRSSSTRSSEGQ
jgi:hypothetical protein